jgi:hypothetical protein
LEQLNISSGTSEQLNINSRTFDQTLIQNTKHKIRHRLNGPGNANALTTTIEQKPQRSKCNANTLTTTIRRAKEETKRRHVNHHGKANQV